jgi:tellurite resistance protein TerC
LPETIGTPLLWTLVVGAVVVTLTLDLGVFNRKEHTVSPREAAAWVAVWVSLALAFGGWITYTHGSRPGLEFFTGYLVEEALSVDNLFVFVIIFRYFAVPPQLQHRVLFWGILGAVLMRGLFVVLGTALITRFEWVLYLFGAFLLFTGIRLLFVQEAEVHPERNPIVGLFHRFVPMTRRFHGRRFFVREGGRLMATPLLLVLAVVEATDVVFAVDSVPAVFGVTRDPFLVFTSNIFAVLGLRSLYFLLVHVLDRFHYLKVALGLVLAFIGAKMLAADLFHPPIEVSLGVVVLLLAGGVVASLIWPRPIADEAGEDAPPPP